MLEPSIKRTVAFIDGQNLFYGAKEAFARRFPDYDPIAITHSICARLGAYDVALIFGRDQDLTESVDEVKTIAQQQDRWIKIASAYPLSPTSRNRRGIDGTDWIPTDRETYEACLDPRDYRSKRQDAEQP